MAIVNSGSVMCHRLPVVETQAVDIGNTRYPGFVRLYEPLFGNVSLIEMSWLSGRLLPSYAYMVAMTSALARASRAVAALPGPHDDRDLLACDTHWWRNLLYVTTAYPQREQVGHYLFFLQVIAPHNLPVKRYIVRPSVMPGFNVVEL